MNYSQLFRALKDLLTSRYVLFLEKEIEVLRAQNGILQLKLEAVLAPKVPEYVKRELPKFTVPQTTWESYLESEIKRQEQEALATKENQSELYQ